MDKPDVGEIVNAIFSDEEIVPVIVTQVSPEDSTWLGNGTIFTAGRQPWDVRIRVHDSEQLARDAVRDNYTYNCWRKEDKVKALIDRLLGALYE